MSALTNQNSYFGALFIRDVYNGLISCRLLLKAKSSGEKHRSFCSFYTSFSLHKCPSVRGALAASEICNNVSMFDSHIFKVKLLVSSINR